MDRSSSALLSETVPTAVQTPTPLIQYCQVPFTSLVTAVIAIPFESPAFPSVMAASAKLLAVEVEAELLVIFGRLTAAVLSTGALLLLTDAVSSPPLNAVMPPLVAVGTLVPAVPDVLSQIR